MIFRILIVLLAMSFPGFSHALDNVAQGKPVILLGDGFNGAEPQSIVDGVFLTPGTPWDTPMAVWWQDAGCRFNGTEPCAIEIDLQGPFTVRSLIFQGDSDHYSVEYWVDEPPGWQPVWLVPSDTAPGLRTRPDIPWDDPPGFHLDPPIVTNRLRIMGVGPDFDYAVSELQAYGEPWDPCLASGGAFAGFGCWRGEPEYQTHIAAGALCYRFKLTCEGFVQGGFGTCVHPNGYFDYGMGAQVGDPPQPDDPPPGPEDPSCSSGGGHMLNDKVEHRCSLEGFGEVRLDVKQVGMVHCTRE